MRLQCDSYDLSERTGLVELIVRRIQCALDTLEAWGEAGVPGWAEMLMAGTHAQGMRNDIAYAMEHQAIFDRALV